MQGKAEATEEAATFLIKDLCSQATAYAEAAINLVVTDHCWSMYIRLRSDILSAIEEIEDDFYRDFCSFCAIEMLVRAKEISFARTLYRRIKGHYVRRTVEHQYCWLLSCH